MTPGRPTGIVLFDVDGTLIDSDGVGSRALDAAFKEAWDIDGATADIEMAGATDNEIIRQVLARRLGVNVTVDDDKMVRGVAAAYLSQLPTCLKESKGYRVLPGVPRLLATLAARGDLVTALATGNLAPGARLKLAKAQLNRFFRTGGFGGDAPTRAGVIAAAISRVAKIIGHRPPRNRIFCVGDTVRDIKAARANGVVPIGVTTGPDDDSALTEAGAEVVLRGLDRATPFLELLGGATTEH